MTEKKDSDDQGFDRSIKKHLGEIVIYQHPNPELKSFLTSESISALRVEHFKIPFDGEAKKNSMSLGRTGSQVVKEISALKGVQEIRIKPKEVIVKKRLISSWEEIEEQIVKILHRALRRARMKVVSP